MHLNAPGLSPELQVDQAGNERTVILEGLLYF